MVINTIQVRRAYLPADYAAISRVIQADWEGASDAEELASEDATRDPHLHFIRLVALVDGVIVGTAEIGHDTWEHRAGKFKFGLWVLPEHWGQGVGKALYQAMLDHLTTLHAIELHVDVWATHPRSVRFVEDRSFVERWRRLDQSLNFTAITAPDETSIHPILKTKGGPITLRNYPQLADDPLRDEKLYALNRSVWEDVPVENATLRNRPLAQFVQEDLRHPDFLPDACFVAVNQLGDYVGLTFHRHNNDDELNIETTGVQRDYRRMGIGIWLKQHAIHYAQTHGYKRIETVNDPSNPGMLTINQRLGFQVIGAQIRYVRIAKA